MPHTLTLNEVYRVSYKTSGWGSRYAFPSFHVAVAAISAPGPTDQDIATLYALNSGALFRGCLTQQANLNNVSVSVENRQPRFSLKVDLNNAGPGTFGANLPLPGQCAAVLSTVTALAGQAYRGRMYIPFLDEAAIVSPLGVFFSAGFTTAAQALAAYIFVPHTLAAGGGSVTLTPVVFHKKAGKKGTPLAGSYDFITGAGLSLGVGTQRRRGFFRANHKRG